MKKVMFLLAALSLLPVVPAWAGTFSDHGNQTVTDADTGLMWQQSEGGAMSWEAALAYCEGLALAGYSDWRLPNFKELESLTDDTHCTPAINSAFFPGAHVADYWSSTTYAYSGGSHAWVVSFDLGNSFGYVKWSSYYVRCVR